MKRTKLKAHQLPRLTTPVHLDLFTLHALYAIPKNTRPLALNVLAKLNDSLDASIRN